MRNMMRVNTLLLSMALSSALSASVWAAGDEYHEQEGHEQAEASSTHHDNGIATSIANNKEAQLRQQIEAELTIPRDTVIAEINGKKVTQGEYLMYFHNRLQTGIKEPIPRDSLIEEVIKRELVTQDAEKRGWSNDPDFNLRIEFLHKGLLSEFALQRYLKENPVTEDDLKLAYEQKIHETPAPKEYRARHILVGSQNEAVEVIALLDKGADFSALAQEKSTDKSSAKKGGDLGWFRKDRMVVPFGNAVEKLEKGAYTKEPVQTDFGWHVILLDDSRDMPPPPFERVHDSLLTELQSKRISDYLADLRAKANIQISEVHPADNAPAASDK